MGMYFPSFKLSSRDLRVALAQTIVKLFKLIITAFKIPSQTGDESYQRNKHTISHTPTCFWYQPRYRIESTTFSVQSINFQANETRVMVKFYTWRQDQPGIRLHVSSFCHVQ